VLATPIAAADVGENLEFKYYTGMHRAGSRLLATLNAASPIRHNGAVFHGYTSWRTSWSFRWWEEADGRCRITGNHTQLSASITLPRLIADDPAIRQRFERYVKALTNHEMAHVGIARQYAQKIDRAILGLPTMRSCRQLEQRANSLARELLEEASAAEREMDQRTRHGASEGASLLDD